MAENSKIERLKVAMGIGLANCETCSHLRQESDGDYGEYKWFECGKVERYQYLKSFPFKKEMPCWRPDFWFSKFADSISIEEDYDKATFLFRKILVETEASNG